VLDDVSGGLPVMLRCRMGTRLGRPVLPLVVQHQRDIVGSRRRPAFFPLGASTIRTTPFESISNVYTGMPCPAAALRAASAPSAITSTTFAPVSSR